MSLFGDLPAAKQAAGPPAPAPAEPEAAAGLQEPQAEPAAKRQRVEAAQEPGLAAAAAEREEPAAAGAAGGEDALAQALGRIAAHIGKKEKFVKAAGLLRQLMEGGGLTKAHRRPFFGALNAAFADPSASLELQLRRDYRKLVQAAGNLPASVLGRQEHEQLEVYAIWAVQRAEMFTDDSFMLNKVIGKLKTAIAALPEADEEVQAAAGRLVLPSGLPNPDAPRPAAGAAAGPAPPAAAPAEADPFGLDDFLARQAEGEAGTAGPGAGDAAAAPAPDRLTWDPAELSVMRAQALLDCVSAAKEHLHRVAWARTSVELFIEEAHKQRAAFVGPQRRQLDELHGFVVQARAARKSGGRGREPGKEMTTFERAQAEWGAVSSISARGAVGGQGDGGSNVWLG